jgi:hypothetical protein
VVSSRRSRALRIVIPIAAAVIVVAGFAAWIAAGPETEHSQPPGHIPVAFLGNSFTGGSLMDSGLDHEWPAIVSKKLELSDSIVTADASGYVTRGVGGATFADLVDRIPTNVKAVVILGSDDDQNQSYDAIKSAALATFKATHTRVPHARILAIATFWVSKDPPKGIITSRDAVKAAAAEAGVQFADPIAGGWLVDDPSKTIGSDGLHPTDLGQAELAARIEPLVAKLLD